MYQHTRLTRNNLGILQKFKNFDYILLGCILCLGFLSLTTMYSTDGGKILFHTKSHFFKLVVFTIMMFRTERELMFIQMVKKEVEFFQMVNL